MIHSKFYSNIDNCDWCETKSRATYYQEVHPTVNWCRPCILFYEIDEFRRLIKQKEQELIDYKQQPAELEKHPSYCNNKICGLKFYKDNTVDREPGVYLCRPFYLSFKIDKCKEYISNHEKSISDNEKDLCNLAKDPYFMQKYYKKVDDISKKYSDADPMHMKSLHKLSKEYSHKIHNKVNVQ